jgi:hypothetical protein
LTIPERLGYDAAHVAIVGTIETLFYGGAMNKPKIDIRKLANEVLLEQADKQKRNYKLRSGLKGGDAM